MHQALPEQPGLPARHPLWQDPQVAALLAAWPRERVQGELDGILELWGAIDLRAVIRWRWNPRLRTTVGRAHLEDLLLELNPRLLARHPEELRPVLAHEAGHLVVQRYFGRQPAHGRIWKALMRRAGCSARATHRLDTRGLRRRRRRRRYTTRRALPLLAFWLAAATVVVGLGACTVKGPSHGRSRALQEWEQQVEERRARGRAIIARMRQACADCLAYEGTAQVQVDVVEWQRDPAPDRRAGMDTASTGGILPRLLLASRLDALGRWHFFQAEHVQDVVVDGVRLHIVEGDELFLGRTTLWIEEETGLLRRIHAVQWGNGEVRCTEVDFTGSLTPSPEPPSDASQWADIWDASYWEDL